MTMPIIIFPDELRPIPVSPPHSVHLFNGNALGLRQEEVDEDRHDQHEEAEEDEETELHVAKHGEEYLRHQKSEQHVDRHVDALSR